MKRRLVILFSVLFLVGTGYVASTLAGLPPVRFILRYGLSPGCEPTGQTMTLEGVEFVEIGPGIFRMGSDWLAEGGDWLGRLCEPLGLPWGQRPRPSNEMPVHWVEFRRGFWIASTEVTNEQYERFKPDHVRCEFSPGEETPVVELTWSEAKEYCAWLAQQSDRPIRLTSEAEWECACRAGLDWEFTFRHTEERLDQYAWFGDDWDTGPRKVATKKPNRWGLYDLHGNVEEWCEDKWHDYDKAPSAGSPWAEGPPLRVRRGGSFFDAGLDCRSASRQYFAPDVRLRTLGMRPAFTSRDD